MMSSKTLSTFLFFLLFWALNVQAQEQVHIEVDAIDDDRFVLRTENLNSSSRSLVGIRMLSGNPANLGESTISTFATNYTASPGYGGFLDLNNFNSGINLRALDANGIIRFMTGGSTVATDTRVLIDQTGQMGIGTSTPASRLQVSGGNIYVSDSGGAVVMTSPDGSCWSLTVANNGSLSTASIPCP